MNPDSARKRLVRRRHDKMLGGVCAGVADYLGLDVTLVRAPPLSVRSSAWARWSSHTSWPGP